MRGLGLDFGVELPKCKNLDQIAQFRLVRGRFERKNTSLEYTRDEVLERLVRCDASSLVIPVEWPRPEGGFPNQLKEGITFLAKSLIESRSPFSGTEKSKYSHPFLSA